MKSFVKYQISKTMKYLGLIIVSAILFAGCGKEDAVVDPSIDDNNSSIQERVISLSAGIPGKSSNLKVDLTQNGKDIELTWQEGDQIQFLVVQGDVSEKQTVTVKDISTDGKTAAFDLPLPREIVTGTFDLYGTYGGTLDAARPKVTLSRDPWNNPLGLPAIVSGKKFMLIFKQKGISVDAPSLSVNFEHIGSLFCIKIKNASSETDWWVRQAWFSYIGVNKPADLSYHPGAPMWGGMNTSSYSTIYDIETGLFEENAYRANFYMIRDYTVVPPGEYKEFWSFYYPNTTGEYKPTVNPIRLDISWGHEGSTTAQSPSRDDGSKVIPQTPAYGEPGCLLPGKVYYMYGTFNDGNVVKIVDPF
jgi:hypothetical protein